jgi:hypothetical protein
MTSMNFFLYADKSGLPGEVFEPELWCTRQQKKHAFVGQSTTGRDTDVLQHGQSGMSGQTFLCRSTDPEQLPGTQHLWRGSEPTGIQPIEYCSEVRSAHRTGMACRERREYADDATPASALTPSIAVFWRFELNNRIFVHRASTALPVTNRCFDKEVNMPTRLHQSQFIEPTSDEGSLCH